MKKNKFLALTMLCSAFCGMPANAQEISDLGLQSSNGTDSGKKDKIHSLNKNDKQIPQTNTNSKNIKLKVAGHLWLAHEVLSYFKGNFGQFYHKPAHLSFVEASRRIDEYRNNKNLKEKYKEWIKCLKSNIKVISYKYRLDDENFKKIFPHGYVVVHKNNLGFTISTIKKFREFLGNEYNNCKICQKAEKLFQENELQKGDFLGNFIPISKFDDKQVFIGLVSMPYILNKFNIRRGADLSDENGADYSKFLAAKKFLFSYTCEQLNEWGKSDYSPIVTLYYKKYDSIDKIPMEQDVKQKIEELKKSKKIKKLKLNN